MLIDIALSQSIRQLSSFEQLIWRMRPLLKAKSTISPFEQFYSSSEQSVRVKGLKAGDSSQHFSAPFSSGQQWLVALLFMIMWLTELLCNYPEKKSSRRRKKCVFILIVPMRAIPFPLHRDFVLILLFLATLALYTLPLCVIK